jgi:plastocyanin
VRARPDILPFSTNPLPNRVGLLYDEADKSSQEGKKVAHRTGKGALVALLAAGSITLGAMPSLSAPTNIKATFSNSWNPTTSRVLKGKRVVWKNQSIERHNIRAYGGNWSFKKPLDPGSSVARRFKKVGTFRFRCTVHSLKANGVWTGMVGKVRVHR